MITKLDAILSLEPNAEVTLVEMTLLLGIVKI